jgi:hypothetical protein
MNKKIVTGMVYVGILASLWARNYLTTPMDLISEKYSRIEHKNGVTYVIDGKYKNVFDWKIEGKRIWAVSKNNKTLLDRFTRNKLEECIFTKVAEKYLDKQD